MIHNDKYLNQINKCLYNYVYIVIAEKNSINEVEKMIVSK